MAFVKAVCRAMERIAPLHLAEKWDNVGLLLEAPLLSKKDPGGRILLTIDLTPPVVDEALARNASMIVSYHPPIFKPLSSLTFSSPLQGSLIRCIQNGISIYSPHTALDSVCGGINDWLAQGLGDGTIKPLQEKDEFGGEGRIITLRSPVKIDQLVAAIKKHLGISQVQLALKHSSPPEHLVSSVAVCAGSGGSVLGGIEADVYLTGEMSHHEVLAAIAKGTTVILCGHTNTERGYLPTLAQKLSQELSGDPLIGTIDVVQSQTDQHPLQIV